MTVLRFLLQHKFDAFLFLMCLIAVYLMTAASSDPLASWVAATPFAHAFLQFQTGNEIILDLSAGVISSVAMFYLLVRVPAHEQKMRIRAHLLETYLQYKQEVIYIFLEILHGLIEPELADKLMNSREFKDYFKSPSEILGQDRTHYIMNNIEEHHLKRIKLECEVLHGELQYALTIIDVQDSELHAFHRRITKSLLRTKNWGLDYDGVKEVINFHWQLFAGWSFVSGYQDGDPLEDRIRRL